MTAKELMIGDWVLCHNVPTTIINIKYDPLLGSRIGVTMFSSADVNEKSINPIPMTSEILERNGFQIGYGEHRGNEGLIDDVNKHYYIKVVSWDDHKNKVGHCAVWNVCIDQHSPIYVHELQHALRLCGLHELADNFKV